jgi:hypothetical protein
MGSALTWGPAHCPRTAAIALSLYIHIFQPSARREVPFQHIQLHGVAWAMGVAWAAWAAHTHDML